VNYVKAQDPFELQHNNWFTEEKRNQEYDRKQRLIACKQELSKN
jgi:hypothetical protein